MTKINLQLQSKIDYYENLLNQIGVSGHKVVFYLDKDKTDIYQICIIDGDQAFNQEVITPTKEEYRFLGWTLDGETVVDINTYSITGDTTFIAKFEFIGKGNEMSSYDFEMSGGFNTVTLNLLDTFNEAYTGFTATRLNYVIANDEATTQDGNERKIVVNIFAYDQNDILKEVHITYLALANNKYLTDNEALAKVSVAGLKASNRDSLDISLISYVSPLNSLSATIYDSFDIAYNIDLLSIANDISDSQITSIDYCIISKENIISSTTKVNYVVNLYLNNNKNCFAYKVTFSVTVDKVKGLSLTLDEDIAKLALISQDYTVAGIIGSTSNKEVIN